MVVLAISIVSKSGKALVSRQFVDMTRIRIEGLLAAFPKLLGSGKQHTYVETENVRYVYQPMEGLYLLLVTNKASNILEDLETLRLLSKVVPEYTHGLDEDSVGRAAFDLLFAFDEVISLGYKENVTVPQVKQNTEMESHEEKLHKMIIQSKINDTKDVMKRKAMEIDKSKVEARAGAGRMGPSMSISSSGMGSSGNLGGRGTNGVDVDSGPSFARPESFSSSFNKAATAAGPKKGMQLGKAKKANDFLDSLRAEGEIVDMEVVSSRQAGAAPIIPAVPSDPVSIVIEERLQVVLNKDGGMENFEVQGTMSLQVAPGVDACLRVAISSGENRGYQFKTHPNIDKTLYTRSNVLGLKDPSRPFPTEGAPVGILKWRMQTQEESALPLSINCWPSTSGSESFVNIEYESSVDFDLHELIVAIPLSQPPRVNQVDGDWAFDSRKRMLLWTVDLVDESNRTGSMEFVVPAAPTDSFFPVEVSFSASHTLCNVAVTGVTTISDDAPTKYACKSVLLTESYQVL